MPAARRQCLRAAIAAVLAAVVPMPRAGDAQRMAQAARQAGPRATAALPALLRLLSDARGQPDVVRLAEVNQFFNTRLQFRDDPDVWGQHDYWASPMEALERGAGDCEDFSIAKYFTLVAMGVSSDRLRLVYVRARLPAVAGAAAEAGAQAHMVTAYYPPGGEEPLILDNLVPDIRRASRRPDLVPVFSFNSDGLWHGAVGAPAPGDATSRLSPWRRVLERARIEGFW